MTELVNVDIASIDANPFRQLDRYPYVERKLETLKRSIADVGLWEGVIARRSGNRYQIAFGHHRIQAARQNGISRMPLIVRDLSDEQMLQFMGRENMEDYNADFLCMLETWEAAITFLADHRGGQKLEPIAIARILGWMRWREERDSEAMTNTASACHAAHALINAGELSRDDLKDMSVRDVREIVWAAHARMGQIEALAKKTQRPADDVAAAKHAIGKAAKETARQMRDGQITQRDARGALDVNAYRFARESKRQTPLFEAFGSALATSIARMLKGDSTEARLEEVRKSLGDVTLDDDKRVIARLDFELGELGERSVIWRKRITPTEKKVTPLQIAKGGEHE